MLFGRSKIRPVGFLFVALFTSVLGITTASVFSSRLSFAFARGRLNLVSPTHLGQTEGVIGVKQKGSCFRRTAAALPSSGAL